MQMEILYFRATLAMEIIMNNHVISKYTTEHKHTCTLLVSELDCKIKMRRTDLYTSVFYLTLEHKSLDQEQNNPVKRDNRP